MNLKQGDLENIILNALWDLELNGAPKIFVGDVQDKIKTDRSGQKEWAYTTVKTVLDRLVDKELVAREKEGKKYYYHSLLQRDEAGFSALSKLLRQYFQNDIGRLERCIQQLKQQGVQTPFERRNTDVAAINTVQTVPSTSANQAGVANPMQRNNSHLMGASADDPYAPQSPIRSL